ncbi:MAG: hypothetical protein DCF25_22160 [Leptolyngbya foveolarum]|uniref:Uncharacterized protein n=1 Tax=Leptolyngbya foveolarum TaxID=47253 RepID=A0A2W4V945_9CYAN|nr:MAG: hypothetical protein DCF25_22160 [Leptolyngbya foveolarum]
MIFDAHKQVKLLSKDTIKVDGCFRWHSRFVLSKMQGGQGEFFKGQIELLAHKESHDFYVVLFQRTEIFRVKN